MALPVDFNLYLITDRKAVRSGRDLVEAVRAALEGGVRAVQLREKDLGARELYSLALPLRGLTRKFGARLLVNDRIDVALAVEADGVHLGGRSLPVSAARKILGPQRLIGVSTHRPAEIAAACAEGADFVTFGPVYATPSKAPYGDPVGPQRLAEACQSSKMPVFALGGVKPDRVRKVLAAGASGVAMISAILSDPDPATATRRLIALLHH